MIWKDFEIEVRVMANAMCLLDWKARKVRILLSATYDVHGGQEDVHGRVMKGRQVDQG